MCDPSHYLPLAKAAEEAGYTSYAIPESICYPKACDTKYPYTSEGERQFLENRPFIEPFSIIPATVHCRQRRPKHARQGQSGGDAAR